MLFFTMQGLNLQIFLQATNAHYVWHSFRICTGDYLLAARMLPKHRG